MSDIHIDDRPYFIVPSAFIVEGATRILLCDTERSENFLVPLMFKRLLANPDGLTLNVAKVTYGYTDVEFDTIVEFLNKNDLVYFSKMRDFYIPLQTTFDYPSVITNAIIDIGHDSRFTPLYAMRLEEINCFHFQVRYLRVVSIDEICELLHILNNKFVKSVELAIPWDNNLTETELVEAVKGFAFLDAIICYGTNDDHQFNAGSSNSRIIYFTKQILTLQSCGIVSPSYFTSSIIAYSESTKHNSCLNRKISIDSNGDIRNCPSMPDSFGNIKNTSLIEAIQKPGFKKYWDINKDKIHVCKDCEFRYICTDCRAYIEDPEDILSKPLKCGYNPYTGEWSEWSTNPLKQKAIEYYGMEELVAERQDKLRAEGSEKV